jgi:hypothetical protein
MRKLLALAVCALLPVGAFADTAAEVKKAAEANHAASMKAFVKKDVSVMMSNVTDDYMATGMGGMKMDKKAMEAQMKEYVKDTKKVHSATYTVTGIKVNGNTATGKAVFKLDADVMDSNGMFGHKGKTVRMVMEDTNMTTWKKVGGKWKTSAEVTTGMPKMTVNGKPFNMGAPPSK